MSAIRVWPLLLGALLLCACTPLTSSSDPWQTLRQPDGSVLWLGEYRFVPPPEWQLLNLEDRDTSLALYKSCRHPQTGRALCQSTIAYAEEPFGHSRDLAIRAGEFLKRFLWASRVRFAPPERTPTSINGRPALIVEATGEEPVTHHRVQARIVLMHRGERVVAFFISQWRDGDAPFSPEEFSTFDRFVASFDFVKPSFYELL